MALRRSDGPGGFERLRPETVTQPPKLRAHKCQFRTYTFETEDADASGWTWHRGRLEFGGDRTGHSTATGSGRDRRLAGRGRGQRPSGTPTGRALTRSRVPGWLVWTAGLVALVLGRHGRLGTRRLRASAPTCCDRRARHGRSAPARTSSASPRPPLGQDLDDQGAIESWEIVAIGSGRTTGDKTSVRPRRQRQHVRGKDRPAARCRPDLSADFGIRSCVRQASLHPGPAADPSTRSGSSCRRPTSPSPPFGWRSPSWCTAPATWPATRRPGTTGPIRLPVHCRCGCCPGRG